MCSKFFVFKGSLSRIQTNFLPILRTQPHNLRYLTTKPKRFYKAVSIARNNDSFQILLDQRALKTPSGQKFAVPCEQLAQIVAAEWNSQKEIVDRSRMTFSALCNSAIDNPTKQDKQSLVKYILSFLEYDTLCFRAEEQEELFQLQQREWGPIIEWFQDRFGVEVRVNSGLEANEVDEKTLTRLYHHLESHNLWSLFGYQYAVEALKSLILTLSLSERKFSVETAVYLSQLELEFQVQKWGNIEWAHQLDREQTRARVSAGILFAQLAQESAPKIVHKFDSASLRKGAAQM